MNRLALLLFAFAPVMVVAREEAAEWQHDSNGKGVLIQSRMRTGSSVREFRAIAQIEAPTARVYAVLIDAEAYPKFMPYVAECRILKREKDALVFYQRLELPLLHDRDFTLRTHFAESAGEHGRIYRMHWEPANELGPEARRGVVRVKLCQGSWLLEPLDEATTRATYTILTDSGGALPAFIENTGSRIAIRKLFEAIRKQVNDPKYAAP